MCGIAGVVGARDAQASHSVDAMLNSMVHRGPDQDGLWQADRGRVVFGHRRLSILDLSDAGRQPMVDRQSGVVLCYNGECYNYQDLRRELEANGYRFESNSDTEVLLKAYLQWGREFLQRLSGMYAFAIWDPRSNETLLVRDRLGIKPLYYSRQNGALWFASEVRGLLASGRVARHLNPRAISSYLWHGFVPGPEAIVDGVLRLAPGSFLRLDGNGGVIEQARYWRLPPAGSKESRPELLDACREDLSRAAAEHLASDVPLGVFLSGGVDSSVVAALAQRQSSHSVMTYNVRFDEKEYDESSWARQVATSLDTKHHELSLTEKMFEDQLEDALAALDQPTFDAINTYYVSRAVKDAGLTVALAGTGGDEIFGGYASFRDLPKALKAARLLSVMPSVLRDGLSRGASAFLARDAGEVRPQVRWGKLDDLSKAGKDLLSLYQVSYSLFNRDFLRVLHLHPSPEHDSGLGAEVARTLRLHLTEDQGELEQISRLELFSFLGERLLPDTDAASMAVSLEVRVPLLDHRFIESVCRLHTEQRYAPIGRKQFLRDIVTDDLDASVFNRPKAGFELPLERWCRNRLATRLDETFSDLNLAHAIGLDGESVVRLWRAFNNNAPGLYWSRLWSLYVLMNWCKRHHLTLA